MTLALIAGRGALPAAIVACSTTRPLVCALHGFQPGGLTPDLIFHLERLIPFIDHLLAQGITTVAFAGAVQRPRLDPAIFDPATAQLVPRLLAAMQGGDDATLREVIALFEESGLTVQGINDIAPGLLPGPGLLAGHLTDMDETDATRAAANVDALGSVDVGQGAVVAQGQCLAVEALPGTDAMLASLAKLPASLRPDPLRGRGLLYKAVKPGQDLRIDLPTLGPESMRGAAAAGLGGIAFQAGSVICLNLSEMRAEADRLDLFLWYRP